MNLMKNKYFRLDTITFFYSLLSLSFFLSSTSYAEENKSLPLEILSLSSDPRLSSTVLIADKTERKLSVFDTESMQQAQMKQQFDIDIGKNDGNKTKRDDKKTPEGIYLLEKKMMPPEIPFDLYGSMAFATNYPNFFDKFENKTGSGIWLHSVPDTVALNRGSRGCVVLRNDAIKKVENFISLGKTFLLINDQINWLKSQEYEHEKQLALDWLNQWKNLWENQKLEDYIQNYADDFSVSNFTKKTWLKHKEELKNRYKYVKIKLSTPHIFHLKNQYLFQFVQDYESDGHRDTGLKNLYVLKEKDQMRIHREEWFGLTQ